MPLDASQQYELEQFIIRGRKADAVKRYIEISGASAGQAEQAVDRLIRRLQQERPWQFDDRLRASLETSSKSRQPGFRLKRSYIIWFMIIDLLLFAAVIYWFLIKPDDAPEQTSSLPEPRPVASIAKVETLRPAITPSAMDSPAINHTVIDDSILLNQPAICRDRLSCHSQQHCNKTRWPYHSG